MSDAKQMSEWTRKSTSTLRIDSKAILPFERRNDDVPKRQSANLLTCAGKTRRNDVALTWH